MAEHGPGWWARSWMWAAPSGCLVVVLLLFGGCTAMFAGLVGMMKDTEPYRVALERAQRSDAVIATLGEPVEAAWWISGNVTESMGSGSADYAIPLSGPRGTGTLYVEARKREGRWHFVVLSFAPEGGEPIDLRNEEESTDESDEDRDGSDARDDVV